MIGRRAALGLVFAAALPGACSAATEPAAATTRARQLIEAARAQTRSFVVYDGRYTQLAYPNGDVDPGRGVCTDVVIRAYRAAFGLDLQALVHEDMTANRSAYPGSKAPDPNIDHRRVPNLARFFARFGESLPVTGDARDYAPGDIVTMASPQHIAIVADRRVAGRADTLVVLQNAGWGVREDEQTFASWPLNGRYRYAV